MNAALGMFWGMLLGVTLAGIVSYVRAKGD